MSRSPGIWPMPQSKGCCTALNSKMDFWNSEQTWWLEIQKAALLGRRDPRERKKRALMLQVPSRPCACSCSLLKTCVWGRRGGDGFPREVLGDPEEKGPYTPEGPRQWGGGSLLEVGGIYLKHPSLFPRWVSPVPQDPGQIFPLGRWPAPQSELPVSSHLDLLVLLFIHVA